jgi:hypothetical protein
MQRFEIYCKFLSPLVIIKKYLPICNENIYTVNLMPCASGSVSE